MPVELIRDERDREKRAAAEAAAELVEPGMRVGLGTGSTVAFLLPALTRRSLDCTYVATSPATEQAALAQGLHVVSLDDVDSLDLAIDGADQIAPNRWLIKGGGGAHTREKIVANLAERFIVIASADKLVEQLSAPVPLELLRFGVGATLAAVAPAKLRDVPPSPDGNLIADYLGAIDEEPTEVAAQLAGVPGVVEHGLFEPELVSDVLVAHGNQITNFGA